MGKRPETIIDLIGGRDRGRIAARAGIAVSTFHAIIHAARTPQLDTAVRIALALHVSLDRFARAWMETRRRRLEREGAAEATREALDEYRRK